MWPPPSGNDSSKAESAPSAGDAQGIQFGAALRRPAHYLGGAPIGGIRVLVCVRPGTSAGRGLPPEGTVWMVLIWLLTGERRE